MCSKLLFFENCAFMKYCEKILLNRTGYRRQYGAWLLRAGYLRLQTHIQNMYYLLLFYSNNGSTNAPHFYVIRTMTALFVV